MNQTGALISAAKRVSHASRGNQFASGGLQTEVFGAYLDLASDRNSMFILKNIIGHGLGR